MGDFTCATCGAAFTLPDHVVARYPGWTPSQCRACRGGSRAATAPKSGGGGGRRGRTATPRGPREEDLTTAEVLARYADGPADGVFTDGAADPNPGPGGWGAVYVVDGEVVAEDWGHDPDTTNNRMELTAIAAGLRLVPDGTPAVIWSDSRLCVDTLTSWAAGWAARGWRRKTGPVQNLDLVRPLHEELVGRPELELRWIKAHDGSRWNEYADALATAYRRAER